MKLTILVIYAICTNEKCTEKEQMFIGETEKKIINRIWKHVCYINTQQIEHNIHEIISIYLTQQRQHESHHLRETI